VVLSEETSRIAKGSLACPSIVGENHNIFQKIVNFESKWCNVAVQEQAASIRPDVTNSRFNGRILFMSLSTNRQRKLLVAPIRDNLKLAVRTAFLLISLHMNHSLCAQQLKIPDRPCPSKCQNLLRFGSEIQSGAEMLTSKWNTLYFFKSMLVFI
jgi:hypothetical protein